MLVIGGVNASVTGEIEFSDDSNALGDFKMRLFNHGITNRANNGTVKLFIKSTHGLNVVVSIGFLNKPSRAQILKHAVRTFK